MANSNKKQALKKIRDTHKWGKDQNSKRDAQNPKSEAEEELRRIRERFQALVETIKDWVWEVDGKGFYTYVSPKVHESLGYEPADLLGKTPFDIMPPEEASRIREIFGNLAKGRKPLDAIINTCLHKDGRSVIMETSGMPFFAADGTLMGFRGVDRDITERKKAEDALREKTEELDRFFSLSLDLLCIANTDGYFQRLNPAWENALGYRPEELEGKSFIDLIHPEDIPPTLEAVSKLSRGEKVINFTNRYRCRDGSYRWIEWRSAPYRQKLIYAAARDITERKKAEEALRKSEEIFSKIFHSSPATIAINDFDNGKYIDVNESFEKISGYNREELIGRTPTEVGLWDRETGSRYLRLLENDGMMKSKEFSFRGKSGNLLTCLNSAEIIEVGGNPLVISVAEDITERKKGEEALRKSEEEAKRLAQENSIMAEISRIISSTLITEEVYERFAAEMRKLVPFHRISINTVDPQNPISTIAHISGLDVAARRQGATFPLEGTVTQEVIRTRSSLLIHPETMNELLKRFPAYTPPYQAGLRSLIAVPLFSRGEVVGVMNISATDQIRYTEKDRRVAERIGSQIAGAIANAKIFAELKRAEEDLRAAHEELERRVLERTAKLADLNRELQAEIIDRIHIEELLKKAKEAAEASSVAKSAFLANMSHELRTPLNAIIGFSELLTDEQIGGMNEVQKEYTEYVVQSGRHLLSLINDILDLSKVEAGKLQMEVGEVFLPILLQNSLGMVKEKSLKHGIRLQLEIDGIPEQIRGDERKLKQILHNLLSNAVKFTPDGGRITLEARRLFSREGRWTGNDGWAEAVPFAPSRTGEWVGISIRDTGIGLKAEDLERIFKPFEQVDNSVSRRFQGTGLGLALTRKFVELHGGIVWAESEGEGKGSRFRFLIPA